jgi:hypothetical protein
MVVSQYRRNVRYSTDQHLELCLGIECLRELVGIAASHPDDRSDPAAIAAGIALRGMVAQGVSTILPVCPLAMNSFCAATFCTRTGSLDGVSGSSTISRHQVSPGSERLEESLSEDLRRNTS